MFLVYEKYQLKYVINVFGCMMMLGVLMLCQDVVEVVELGLNYYFVMKDLVNQIGVYIVKLLNVESVVVVFCVLVGIVQLVVVVIVKDNVNLLVNLYVVLCIVFYEIVLFKGYNVNFGVLVDIMVILGGGKVVEVGYVNECLLEQLEVVIMLNIVVILYIKFYYCV